jgi:crossover junction endodeoxyribonuclease RuvC
MVGIDPGLRVTGYGVIMQVDGEPRLEEAGVVETDAAAPLERRLHELHASVAELLAAHSPDVVVIEDLYSQYTHPRTAILMGHARGVVCLAAAECGAEVVAYPPALVKRSLTGNGRAPKEQVAKMVAQMLGLGKPPSPADVSDALALALCHCAPARRHGVRRPRRRRALPPAVAERLGRTPEA